MSDTSNFRGQSQLVLLLKGVGQTIYSALLLEYPTRRLECRS